MTLNFLDMVLLLELGNDDVGGLVGMSRFELAQRCE
jgi:hypothetical protein